MEPDQDSGNDSYFDLGYRALLRGVYESLGLPVPTFVDVPIIGRCACRRPGGAHRHHHSDHRRRSKATRSGQAPENTKHGAVPRPGPAIVAADFYYGYDRQNLYVRVDAKQEWTALGDAVVGVYIGVPGVSSPVGTSHFGVSADSADDARLQRPPGRRYHCPPGSW